jgi:hypothetical protein
MLSLLLITALAVQTPQTSKPAAKPATPPAQRGTSQSAISKQAFHDRMRELWSDHIVYTRGFIVSATAGNADTAEVLQRLLRNQDELGEAIKPYYGEEAGTQLASLLRNHIQLAGKTLLAAKGTSTAMTMNQSPSSQFSSTRPADTVSARTDTTHMTKQPSNQYGTVRTDSASAQTNVSAQGQTPGQLNQPTTVDSTALNQSVAALKANADSIADFLAKANPRGFNQATLRSAVQMHITLLLNEATAQIKKDWSGSIAAFDESVRQATQMADLLSDGIMKQFPSRFSNKAVTVSSR